jgi:hypothetical protein
MADMKWSVSNDREDNEAYIENERGVECVQIQRTDRTALTESEFDVLVDLIAAAPEMLTLLRDLSREIRAGSILDAGNIEEWGREIDALIAKAEPPRTVKKRLLVSVEVEVEADSDATLDVFKTRALDSVYTGGGVCVSFKSKKVTTIGELYEE